MSTPSIVVIHPYQQHSLKTAVAVKQAGVLQKYITTVYNKRGSWTNRLQFLLSKENKLRSEKRKIEGLDDENVLQICEIRSLFLLVLQRVDRSRQLYNWYFQRLIKAFNKKVFNYLKKTKPDAIIVYDTMSADLIQRIRQDGIKIKVIIDMSAPYYNYMEAVFNEDILKHNGYADDLKRMLDSSIYRYRRKYSKYEIDNADAFLVASNFTKKTIEIAGVKKPTYLCQYGIDDFAAFDDSCFHHKKIEKPIKALYVGRVNQAKGAYQLIEIGSQFSENEIVFDFYGAFEPDSEVIKGASSNCMFHGHVPRSEMINAYRKADIMILPSLADGFGFVIPEALSYDVPVITTKNVGASQIIIDGMNGYVIDAGDDHQLQEIIQRIIAHPEEIMEMRKNCGNSIKDLSWSNYNSQVRKAIDDIFKSI